MGPRKFGVVKKRSARNWIPSSQERRSKSRNEESIPCPSTAPSSSLVPPPSLYAGRVVTTGRKINFDFLEREGFTIGRALIARGWDYMCSLDLPTYPALVREFYEKLARGSGGFVSAVRGTEIRLTEQSLARLLKLSREGPAPSIYDDREDALREILQRDDVGELTVVSANQLSAELRLLHNIIGRIFFPKIGRFDFISERDLVMMQFILKGMALNLPRMMMVYIGEAIHKRKTSLPYGMFLTLLFRESGVQIPDGEISIKLRHTDFYNEKSLIRMGCEKKDGTWIRKGGVSRPAEKGEPSTRHDTAPGSPPDSSSPPAAGPAASPAPAPSSPGPSAPQATHSDDDMRRLAVMVAEETAARMEAIVSNTVEMIGSRLREHLAEETAVRVEASVSSAVDRMGSRLSMHLSDEIARLFSQHVHHPAAQPETSAAQPEASASQPVFDIPAAAPIPGRPSTSAAPSVSARPPRPPRATSLRSGPASRTRSRTPARSSDSPPSVHLPDSRTLRVYSRSSRRRSSAPIDIPSE